MKNTKVIIWALVAAVVVAVGFLVLRPAGSVEDVDAAKVAELAAQGVRIVDVRTPAEFEAGRIPGAESVPLSEFEATSAGWDHNEPIVIYCTTGERSLPAVEYLASQGFSHIYHFAEGLVAWTGDIEQGAMAAAAVAQAVETSGTPVMYEFYTDW